MSEELSRSNSRATSRAKPVMGGKSTCCRCDLPHAPGSGYCVQHRAEYMRDWRLVRKAELERLRALERAQNAGTETSFREPT